MHKPFTGFSPTLPFCSVRFLTWYPVAVNLTVVSNPVSRILKRTPCSWTLECRFLCDLVLPDHQKIASNTPQDSFLLLSPTYVCVYSFSLASISLYHAFRGKTALSFPLWISFFRIKKSEQDFLWRLLPALDWRSQLCGDSSLTQWSQKLHILLSTSTSPNTPLNPLKSVSSHADDVITQKQMVGEQESSLLSLSFRFLDNHYP